MYVRQAGGINGIQMYHLFSTIYISDISGEGEGQVYYLCDLPGCYSEDNTEMLEHQENSQEPLCQVSRRQARLFLDIIIDY